MPCTDQPRRLIGDSEIQDAALWRLADWTPGDIEASSAPLVRLVRQCPLLDSAHPATQALLADLHRPGDRRGAWTALCALAVFWAEAHDDQALYHRAGFEVLASYRQAMRGHQAPTADALDELMTSYLRLHPETTAGQLFEHCKRLAAVYMVVEGADNASLTYRVAPTSSRLKTLRWGAFKVRVSRIRKRLAAQPGIPAPKFLGAGGNVFRWPALVQPVVVTCAG